jgi:hypothetical protein
MFAWGQYVFGPQPDIHPEQNPWAAELMLACPVKILIAGMIPTCDFFTLTILLPQKKRQPRQ